MDVRESLANKLKTARSSCKMSTRRVAELLSMRIPISHATIANYEAAKSVPPADILAALAGLYDRPLNWFLERGESLSGVRYRNLKSRVKAGDLHQFEAHVQRWIDAYVILEQRLQRPLKAIITELTVSPECKPDELSREVRERLGVSPDEPITSVVEVLETFGIRVLEQATDLRIDGLAARYVEEYVVVLNPTVSNDRVRFNAAHELAHVLYGDCDFDEGDNKEVENRAFEFASYLLLPNSQLKRAFTSKSMVRLVQFKERFGISLAAMVYRAAKLEFITKREATALWIEFARRGWKVKEPGNVHPDRATRFEQLIEEALTANSMSLKEIADVAGVRPDAIRQRLNTAMGVTDDSDPEDERVQTLKFPE